VRESAYAFFGSSTAEDLVKHDWKIIDENTPERFMRGGPKRQCQTCGAIQTRERQTSWMRVTGYHWYPLVGRCKPEVVTKPGATAPSTHQN
jgi:hypothetical protein